MNVRLKGIPAIEHSQFFEIESIDHAQIQFRFSTPPFGLLFCTPLPLVSSPYLYPLQREIDSVIIRK